ncbi:unnamed protein product [Rotaria sp. Silwood1]|nr:unnamed protein product [Rotaria sp. Silwood1]
MILHLLATCAFFISLGADGYRAHMHFTNTTTMKNYWYRTHIVSKLGSYIINIFILIPALYYVIEIYLNIMHKSEKLKLLFYEDDDHVADALALLYTWSETLFMNKKSEDNNKLKQANIFSSVYVLCCMVSTIAYIYYTISVQKSAIRYDLYFKCISLFISYTILVITMWLTDKNIDEMKNTIIKITTLKSMKNECIVQNINMTSLKYMLKHYRCYAELFSQKPNVPAIIITLLIQGITLITPYIKEYAFINH